MKRKTLSWLEWTLGALIVVSSIAAWWLTREPTEGLTLYDIFPPLGLIAFGLMWSHYVMAALRRFARLPAVQDTMYQSVSMGLVLGLIITHPLLLWVALFKDGFGLPPSSHMMAYGDTSTLALFLGTLALTVFLVFELKRWFGRKKWWSIVEWAQVFAMAAIFYHALDLGQEIRTDWFSLIWWFYGVTLVIAISYSTYVIKKEKRSGRKI